MTYFLYFGNPNFIRYAVVLGFEFDVFDGITE